MFVDSKNKVNFYSRSLASASTQKKETGQSPFAILHHRAEPRDEIKEVTQALEVLRKLSRPKL